MAEYSKEFLEEKGWEDWKPDFSIMAIYNSMNDGEVVHRICEGYGFFAIKKINNNCELIFTDRVVLFGDLITSK